MQLSELIQLISGFSPAHKALLALAIFFCILPFVARRRSSGTIRGSGLPPTSYPPPSDTPSRPNRPHNAGRTDP